MGRKFGFSFSWKRALGISAAKGKISRLIGIPLTKSGRHRKVGRLIGDAIGSTLIAAANRTGARAHTENNDPEAALAAVQSLRNQISTGKGFSPGSPTGQTLIACGGRQCPTCHLVFGAKIPQCEKCGAVLT